MKKRSLIRIKLIYFYFLAIDLEVKATEMSKYILTSLRRNMVRGKRKITKFWENICYENCSVAVIEK